MVLTGTTKITYVPISFLVFLVPVRCFSGRRSRLVFICSALAMCWAVALSWIVHYDFNPGLYWRQGGDPKAALAFVLGHPLSTLNGFWQMVYRAGWYLWTDMDVRFGGHAAPFHYFAPFPLPALEAMGLIGLALLSGVKGRHRRIVLACAMGCLTVTVLVAAAFRLTYGPPDSSTIFGLQGRYFVPATLLGLLALAYAVPPIRGARLAAALVLCTHAAGAAYGINHYLQLWR